MTLFIRFLPYIIALTGTLSLAAVVYNQGKKANEVDTLKIAVQQTTQAVKDKEHARKIVNKATDVDVLLDSLGIMRADEDR